MGTITEETWQTDEDAWRAAVEKALKGADLSRLNASTRDGFDLTPLYAAGTAGPIATGASTAPWSIIQRIDLRDPAAANSQALEDLEQGATGLELVFETSPRAWFGGLPLDREALRQTLDGVLIDLIPLRIDAGIETVTAVGLVAEVAAAVGIDRSLLRLRGGHDPAGLVALGLTLPDTPLTDPLALPMTADGRLWHAAGASASRELALVLGTYAHILRELPVDESGATRRNLALDITLVAEPDQFATIAKLRAARMVLAHLHSAAGLSADLPAIHSETSWRDLTRHDAHVNMLRTTTAALAASAGGARSLTILPFTTAIGVPDRLARRMARNTQVILQDEAHLTAVTDPAAGSGAFETLSQQTAATAWTLFQDLEARGGIIEALRAGLPQQWLADTRRQRRQDIEIRATPIVGTSLFPRAHEEAPKVLSSVPGAPPAPVSGAVPPLPVRQRDAEPYERLRERADALRQAGVKPAVFLAPLGSMAGFADRAAFASGLFEAGGLFAPVPGAARDPSSLAGAFQASNAPFACLVGADADYAKAAERRQDLARAGAQRVFVVARPGDAPDGFTASDCIHRGSNAITMLTELLDALDAHAD